MGAALKLTAKSVPKQASELCRFKVVKGPDAGATFVLTAQRATLGRGDENDIVLSDLKTSRKHIAIEQESQGGAWVVKDQGSANGILINGEPMKQGVLGEGTLIALGETLLEFSVLESGTMVLTAPARTLGPAQTKHYLYGSSGTQTMIQAGIKRAPAVAEISSIESADGSGGMAPEMEQFNKKSMMPLILLIAGGYGLYEMGMLDDILGIQTPKPKKVDKFKDKKNTATAVARNLASYLPKDSLKPSKDAQSLFKAGFREYREGNFLRAKTLFETALQISPGHAECIQYLEMSEREIYKSVDLIQRAARHDFELGRYAQSRANYEAILRYLYQTPEDPAVMDAKERIKEINRIKKEQSL